MIEPFKDIALAFSGGGFRAAGFTLGTLSYFEHIGLLSEVKGISSVSGGSITAVKYAESLIDGEDFDTFFKAYYLFLKDDNLADDAIANLNNKKIWLQPENLHKSQNAINSFAIEYNKFTNQKTLGDFHEYAQKENSKLKKLIINATDFSEAIQFRIKNISGSEDFGNNKSDSPYLKEWKKVKLGDALAASSAFPGGFEPILFPNDFIPGTKNEENSISLMDGGIVDNQGATSLMPSNPKSKSKFGFYFVSDVASPYIDKPLVPLKAKFASALLWLVSSFVVALLLILLTVYCFLEGKVLLYSIGLILSTVVVVVQAGLLFASRKVNEMTGTKNRFRLPTGKLGRYIVNRMYSLLYMMSIVMLKNNRRNNANNLYGRFRDRAATSSIYELRCEKGQPKDKPKVTIPEYVKSWDKIKPHTGDISNAIKKVAKSASLFGTTLWFKENKTKDELIACGEFTACYNLIVFLVTNQKEYSIELESLREELLERLKSDWKEFQAYPNFLLEKRKQKLDF